MNRKQTTFLALLVYSLSEGGKARPEALETNPGHLARSHAKIKLPFCYVNNCQPDCLFGVGSVSFSRCKGLNGKHLRPSCGMINFEIGDEFTSLGFLTEIAYSEGMLCLRKFSLFLILIYSPVIYMKLELNSFLRLDSRFPLGLLSG